MGRVESRRSSVEPYTISAFAALPTALVLSLIVIVIVILISPSCSAASGTPFS